MRGRHAAMVAPIAMLKRSLWKVGTVAQPKPAMETVGLRFEPMGGIAYRAFVAVWAVVGLLLGAGEVLPTTAAVLYRKQTGDVLARGGLGSGMRPWFEDVVKKDLRRRTEAEFLERWADPARWTELYGTWPPGPSKRP